MFVAGDLVLAGSDYCAYFPMAAIQNRGVAAMFEWHGAGKSDFRRRESIGTRDHLLQVFCTLDNASTGSA